MKKLILIIGIVLFGLISYSQTKSISNSGENLAKKDSITSHNTRINARCLESVFGTSIGTGIILDGTTLKASVPLQSISGLTETNGGLLYGTADNAYAWLAAGTANYLLQGNGAGAPSFTNAPTVSAANMTSFPTLNQNTTGSAASATLATNLAGGLGGYIPYQSAVNTTAMLANGTSGKYLMANGTTVAPSWEDVSVSAPGTVSQVLKSDGSGNLVASDVLSANATMAMVDGILAIKSGVYYYSILAPSTDDGLLITANNGDGKGNRNIIITDQANYTNDHDHDAFSPDPTLFLHSVTDPDSDNTEWMSFTHNQTNGVISTGKGSLILDANVGITGGQSSNTTVVSGSTYNILTTDYYIDVTYTGTGSVAITIPTAQNVEGRTIVIKDAGFNASAFNITVDCQDAGDKIDGEITGVTMATDGASITLHWNATVDSWLIN